MTTRDLELLILGAALGNRAVASEVLDTIDANAITDAALRKVFAAMTHSRTSRAVEIKEVLYWLAKAGITPADGESAFHAILRTLSTELARRTVADAAWRLARMASMMTPEEFHRQAPAILGLTKQPEVPPPGTNGTAQSHGGAANPTAARK